VDVIYGYGQIKILEIIYYIMRNSKIWMVNFALVISKMIVVIYCNTNITCSGGE